MRRLLPALVLTFGAACSAAPPEPVAPPPAPPPPPPATVALPPAPPPVAEAIVDAGAPDAAPPAPAAPLACPPDMKLVDGDYCPKLEENKCLKSWYDKSNKKTVCEQFQPGTARCLGPKEHRHYCIDTYEWPNQKGERPEVMNRFHQAEVKCAAVGKRMCTESEWTLACEGPEMKPFPYGYVRDATKCNGDHPWDEPNMKKVAKRDAV